MAVVISQEQNEIQTFQKWGLDIKYHREKMEKRELDKEFKDPANPLRVVFVCSYVADRFRCKMPVLLVSGQAPEGAHADADDCPR